MEYKVIHQWWWSWSFDRHHQRFADKVNSATAEGWRPHGSLNVDAFGTLRQAMVREV